MTGAQLLDTSVENDQLDLKIAVKTPDSDDNDSDDDEDDEYIEFCVFGKKICIYGNDGLFTADTTDLP